MRVYVPVNPVKRVPPIALSVMQQPAQADGLTIGIIDDELDPPFMAGMVAGLRERFPEADVRVWTKPVGTSPAPESLIDEVVREAQIALAGVGL